MSGTEVPYHLRVNKYIERQVFAEALGYIDHAFRLSDYAYVSMGGAYLEDFRMVHKLFGIRRLFSFDAEQAVIARQRVNAPFDFITCECAKSGQVIDNIEETLSTLGVSNAIVWLDYTTPKNRRQQLLELQKLVQKLGVGDVVKITLNADPGSLGDQKDHAIMVAKATVTPQEARMSLPFTSGYHPRPPVTLPSFPEWRLEKLKDKLGEFCPNNLPEARAATGPEGIARILAEAVRLAAVGGIEGRKATHRLEPIYAVRYSDRQQMMTVMAVILDHADTSFLTRTRLDAWQMRSETWDQVHEVTVPYLSIRERFQIHTGMGRSVGDSHAALGFMLDDDEAGSIARLEQYRCHYLRYPSFVSADL